ncbi:mutT/nudix family protein [Streptococcus pneumoniae 2070335]|nr:mutT/nudix family protein [Streptococcus pneumoniae 2070335]
MQWQTQLSEKKANTDYIARYGVYAVIPNPEQNKLFLFKNQMVLGSYHVEKLKQVKIIRKP